ncbi:CHAT domain-containing protein [Scytonema sp. UIC 10036]|uniref:nSTAND1 domain-containing NTPase n=1 Tax=Scytonema sp. UIC 10036 TaxID=2304196 RepID=UPI0012DA1FF8|nr:CHAT domain-containing protein [Scytonema sp. UIC 10036]MUG91166.1 CHAT domain-containing protein [Scytonema sp. UIC 10036]
MSKSIVINLGQGNLDQGFPRVTVQLWGADYPLPEQFIGGLPPAPELVELCRNWQSIYQNICDRKQWRSSQIDDEDDEFEIDEGSVTNVSVLDFHSVCNKLQQRMNDWLQSQGILKISQQLRSALNPTDEIRVIIQTNDLLLRKLPWHRCDFFRDYPLAEIALSQPEYKRAQVLQPKVKRTRVRILAILGNSFGIDLAAERQFLNNLADAEVVFLVKPLRQELNTYLWDSTGWDVVFFAGHSHTEGETGRLYINENETNNSLTVEQLEEALKAAIVQGLKLAIFNSCDGLGLSLALEKLNIPTVIVMREPVPNYVAQEFFKHFLEAFAVERRSLYLSVQQARRKLQGLEDDLPGASWLPTICQNPAVKPPTWLTLSGMPPCPYRGLFAFREEDAHLFFGREKFTQNLVTAVKKKPFVAVVGSSGSGKSSVIFAGLVPRLRQDTNVFWQIISFRPGNKPITALAEAFAPLSTTQTLNNERFQSAGLKLTTQANYQLEAGVNSRTDNSSLTDENFRSLANLELELALEQDDSALYTIIETFVQQNPGTRLVLIADQFEELYTLCPEHERQHTLNLLLNACTRAPGFTLVTTLRADFYGYALSYRPLSDALQGAVLNLAPMSREELHDCIEKPAAQMQVELEKELTNKLISALEGQPGRLPLLEFTLTQLWSKQSEGLLSVKAYEEIGGVEEALANHAEGVYSQLSETDRQRSQRVFMQLVQLAEGGEATRRLATRAEVKEENWDLVTHLASKRLVVTNLKGHTCCETVEIVHEALIKSWGRLEYWLQMDGEFRNWQEKLRVAIGQWESSNLDEGALLRGKPLSDAEYWQTKRWEELSVSDRNFIHSSLELREREVKQQKRRQQITILSLASGMAIASILAAFAGWQWQKAQVNEIQATIKSSQALFASDKRLDALVQALRANRKLQMVGTNTTEIKTQVDLALRQAIYGANEYNRLIGHSAKVHQVKFSPNAQTIATASADMTVKLWGRDGRLLKTLIGHKRAVYGVAFSPQGNTIASTSDDGTVKLWTLDGTLLRTLNHFSEVYAVAFSPDGQTLASATWDGSINLWKRDGTLFLTIPGHSESVDTIAFSPDGKTIASGSWDKTVKLWKLNGTLLTTLQHNDKVLAISFSPNGQFIATASADKTVKLWKNNGQGEFETRPYKIFKGHEGQVHGVAFSPDSRLIASIGWDKTAKLWQLDGTEIAVLKGHSGIIWGVTFSPQGNTIATASDDKTVRLWRWKHPLLTELNGHSAAVHGVKYSPDGQFIATASEDHTVKLWRSNGNPVTTFTGHSKDVWDIAFHPNGQLIATASWDKTVKLWKRDGTFIKSLVGHRFYVNAVAFSPDGKMLASASDDTTVKLWQTNGTPIATSSGHTNEVWAVTFSPDSQTIVSASRDNTVKFWRRDGTLVRTLYGRAPVTSVAFSPNGQLVATGSWDKTVKVWKSDGTLVTTLNGHNAEVFGVAFNPDGNIIASASGDKTVKLWRTTDGTLLTTFKGHNGIVWKVAFNHNGETIVSSDEDKRALVWNWKRFLQQDELQDYGCQWLRDYLRTNADVQFKDNYLCDFTSPKNNLGD